MKTIYDPSLKAHGTTDDGDKARHIPHSQEFSKSDASVPPGIPQEQLQLRHETVSFYDPHEHDSQQENSSDEPTAISAGFDVAPSPKTVDQSVPASIRTVLSFKGSFLRRKYSKRRRRSRTILHS